MESVILTFHIQGRRGKAKLPPLPQDLRDALERCWTWMPAPVSHMPGLCLCDEPHFQRWLDEISDTAPSLELRAVCFLCCRLEQQPKGVLTIPAYLLKGAHIQKQAEMSLLEPGCILVRAKKEPNTKETEGECL